ncbi:hypothetical protein FVEG_17486 [Fusarium verticillioides 7600]|uniref:BZIP domain-containing protein n=1 Tax=Gibberella moniliformis (strain M3125 / FGSC 7600) TaxID=334819 RepID=W7N6G7_GIBM7|nr:hypothetical protein FVEG_17486 [Fusarium verticillioides 7600]EWG55279.1 hypothetical protein FVEG_17486 [Fusarium verticillioides 7600]
MEYPANMAAAPLIKLSDMAQLREIRTASEDWTGITSTSKRRKLQNRLNQRAYERRKASRRSASLQPEQGSIPRYATMATPDASEQSTPQYLTMVERPAGYTPKSGCVLLRPDAQGAIRQFVKKAYEDYVLGCPQPWYLSTLIQVNVFNALVQNGIALGFSDRWQRKGVISPFSIIGPLEPCDSYPENLQPTALQRTVRHHPWIDLNRTPK